MQPYGSKSIKRLFTRLRGRYPLAGACIGLLLGQIIGSISLSVLLLTSVLFILLILWYCFPNVQILVICIAIGILSIQINKTPVPSVVDQNTKWLIFIKQVSHPRTDELRAVGDVLGCGSTNNKGSLLTLSACPVSGDIILVGAETPWNVWGNTQKGSTVLVSGKFIPYQFEDNPFSYTATLYRQGIRGMLKVKHTRHMFHDSSQMQTYIENLMKKLKGKVTEFNSGGLFLSMAFGSKDELSDEEENLFRTLGLSHLLVFSGYQVSLIFYSLIFCLKKVALPFSNSRSLKNILLLICGICVAVFSLMIDSGHSTQRAVIALIALVLATFCDLQLRFGHALLVAIFILSLLYPGSCLEPGTQLTCAALIGIGLVKNARGVQGAFQLAFSIGFCTGIVSYLWFGSFSTIGILLNPILAPLLSFLSCNIGYVVCALFISGIDAQGIGIEWVCWIIDRCIASLEFALTCNFWGLNHYGISSLLVALSCMTTGVFIRRYCRNWVIKEGITRE